MSKEELLDMDECVNWEPKDNESRGKIRKYKCDCLDDIKVGATTYIERKGSCLASPLFSEPVEVTNENIEKIKSSVKKECSYCGGTGIAKACKKLCVHTVNFDFILRSNYSPTYGNIKCFANGFYLEEQLVFWCYKNEEWDSVEDDDDIFIDEDKPLFLTKDINGKNTERFTFDGADIIRLFELKGYDFDDTNEDWWQVDYHREWGGSRDWTDYDYIRTTGFNPSLLKFNFEEEDTYETCMKKWESFKRSFKRVSSVDHFYPIKN